MKQDHKTDWERDLCEQIDAAAKCRAELEYYAKVEEIINSVEDLIHEAYMNGKLHAR